MDTVQLTFELPRGIFSALRQEPDQFLREMLLAAAVKWMKPSKFHSPKLLKSQACPDSIFWRR